MCLLIVAYDKFPSREILQKGEKSNGDGAGIAWREDGKVKWQKGLKARELMEFAAYGPPWVIHFRRATVGKGIPELTHPFGVNEFASLETSGETEGGLLAHNGSWLNWHSELINLINSGHKLPDGPWSDTRALAWAAHVKGVDWLKDASSGDKIAYFSPTEIRRFGFWALEDKVNNIAYSQNPHYSWQTTYYNDEYWGGRSHYPAVKTHFSSSTPILTAHEYDSYDDFIDADSIRIRKNNELNKQIKQDNLKIVVGD